MRRLSRNWRATTSRSSTLALRRGGGTGGGGRRGAAAAGQPQWWRWAGGCGRPAGAEPDTLCPPACRHQPAHPPTRPHLLPYGAVCTARAAASLRWKGAWRRPCSIARPAGLPSQNAASSSSTPLSSSLGGAASSAAGARSSSTAGGGSECSARQRTADTRAAGQPCSATAHTPCDYPPGCPPVRPCSLSSSLLAYSHWPAGVVTSCAPGTDSRGPPLVSRRRQVQRRQSVT